MYSTRSEVFVQLKLVPQVAHDRDTYATPNISPQHDLKPLGIQVYNGSIIFK